MSKNRSFGLKVLFSGLMLCGLFAFAADSGTDHSDIRKKISELEIELKDVQQDLGYSQKAALGKNKEFIKLKNKLTYDDPGLKKIYDAVKEAEGDLRRKQAKFDEAIQDTLIMRDFMEKRTLAFKKVTNLKTKVHLISNELKALRYKLTNVPK